MSSRAFLFLQGPSSMLFKRIGERLIDQGYAVHRINICPGDWIFWHGRHTKNYRGRSADWPAFFERFCRDHGITDLLLLGEERPYHKKAIEVAIRLDIAIYVIEMGYLRPDWIVIERGGMSSNSHFPNDPKSIMAVSQDLADPVLEPVYRHGFLAEALSDLAFNLPNVAFAFLYPHYRTHALFHPLREYRGWIGRFFRSNALELEARRLTSRLQADGSRFFLFPLQLETDYQIRAHSTFSGQEEAIGLTIASFASNADPDSRLAFKLHPLDNGLIDWRACIRNHARLNGVEERVFFIAGGDLDTLIGASSGVVTINSTVGIHSLIAQKPTRTLGTAIYDIRGLTDQGHLDAFWQRPQPPDPALCRSFLRLLAAAIHVRGNFYSRTGVEAAANSAARRLIDRTVNEPGAFCPVPPRLKGVGPATSRCDA